MFKIALILGMYALFIQQHSADCQVIKDDYSGKCVYKTVDIPPKFGNHRSDLAKYIRQHFDPTDHTPFQATFSLKCIVDSSGKISFVRSNNKSDKELTEGEKVLIELVSKMPSWAPGQCKGKRVNCIVSIPIIF